MKLRLLTLATLLCLLFGSTKASAALSVSGGDVPLPVKVIGGTSQVSWNGTYAELLAADALAMCWTTQQDRYLGRLPQTMGDALLSALFTKMSAAACKTSCATPPVIEGVSMCPMVDMWLDGRKDPTCNVDAATGVPKALNLSRLRAAAQTAPYALPTAAALGLSGTAAVDVRNRARDEVAYAELSLCMAQQLREKLDTVQVAFASGEDLLQLHELARERALTAVHQYAVMGRALGTTRAAPTQLNDANYYLAPLAIWGRGTFNNAVAWQAIGNDYAAAIDLLIETTEASMDLKLRDPAAQRSFGESAGDFANAFIRLNGPRVDLLDTILYGLGAINYNQGRASPGVVSVLTDMSAPQVGVLLAIARRANALRLSVSSFNFITGQSARRLYAAAENQIRSEECARGISSACAPTEEFVIPGVGGDFRSFLLWQRFGIDFSHALTLVQALGEGVFGLPLPDWREDVSNWLYVSTRANLLSVGPGQQRPFHLLGAHSFTGTQPASPSSNAVGEVVIDPNFRMRGLRAYDRQSTRFQAQLPAFEVDPAGNAAQQLGDFRFQVGPAPGSLAPQGLGTVAAPRPIGSVTALALAREGLVHLGWLTSTTGPKNIYTQALPVLLSLDRAIGTRQVVVRQRMRQALATAACSTCLSYSPFYTSANGQYDVSVDIITRSTDPISHMAIVPGLPLAMTAVQDPAYVPPAGTRGSAIPTQTYNSLISSAAGAYVWKRNTGSWTTSSWAGVSAILRSGGSTFTYEHAYTGPIGVQSLPVGVASRESNTFGTVVAFGGSFGQTVERAWTFDQDRWSSPEFDGFGLPRDWSPAADASLQGNEGASVERHYLDRAASAAAEATDALQQAFETLQQEAVDDAALTTSESRAQQLTSLEYQSLCGSAANCAPPTYVTRTPVVPSCSGTGEALTFCQRVQTILTRVVGTTGVPIETNVNSALGGSGPPTFPRFRGGELQGLLLNEWNAWQGLSGALEAAMGTTRVAMADYLAAKAETVAAGAEYAAVNADVTAGYAQLNAQGAGLEAQAQQYQANKTQYDLQVQAASDEVGRQCSDAAEHNAIVAGWSFSGDDLYIIMGEGYFRPHGEDSRTWSASALIAQMERCAQARADFELAMDVATPQKEAIQALIDAIRLQLEAIGPQYVALDARLAAAQARREVAIAREGVSFQQRGAAVTTAGQAVQASLGQLLTSIAGIDQAFAQAGTAAAKIALDQVQASYDIRTRFGVRKRFRSYDLWRARALTENARRLAVAARRALESRYVIDLSELKAREPFVDAPSLWADEVFAPDLKPPIALGLTRGPTTASGIYTNKLVDYVDNLKLFLDGFAVQRPTARVRADAEVLQLPGPSSQVVSSAFDADVSYIDPSSIGWAYYCANTNTWVSHPNAGTFVSGQPAWQLSTACAGKPPTLARLGFWLDPWGRLGRSTANPPATARYNVRVGNLAVNLVGTGIHDCGRAADPSACYAEPFLRYGLRQTGPIWVTNYEQAWRSLDVPPAVIEDGKALAIEEWLDPVSNGFNRPDVINVARPELHGRPIGGSYEITIELTPEVRVERIERIQLLMQTEYWVRQR